MKKLIYIIMILIIILIGLGIYRNINIKSNATDITVEEIEKIETYITKIYMWKEVTNDALPEFEDINKADELWLWEVVRKNLEEYELTYNQIEEKKKELFGDIKKEFPKMGSDYIQYDEEKNIYLQIGMGLDQLEDNFVLNTIEKTNTGFEATIIEYLEDYSDVDMEGTDQKIIIRNINNEEIGQVLASEEESVKEFVKNNQDKFTKKKIVLKEENDNLYVQKVIKEE